MILTPIIISSRIISIACKFPVTEQHALTGIKLTDGAAHRSVN